MVLYRVDCTEWCCTEWRALSGVVRSGVHRVVLYGVMNVH